MKTNEYKLKVIAFRAPCERLRLRIGSIFHLSKSDATNYHRASGQLANAQKLQFFFPFSVHLQGKTKPPPATDMSRMVIEYSQAWRTYRLSIYFCGAAACRWYVWTVFVLRRFPLCSTTMSPSIRLPSRPQQLSLRSGCSFTLQFLTPTSGNLCFRWWIAVGTRSERTVMHASGCPDSSGDFCPLTYSSDRN